MVIKNATLNGIKPGDFTIAVPDREEWKLPLYTLTDFFKKYCGVSVNTVCHGDPADGHRLIVGGKKLNGYEYARFETEIYAQNGDIHLGCANPTMAQKAIYTFIANYMPKNGDIILPEGKAVLNSSRPDDWRDADPVNLLTVQDRILRSAYKLECILQYDTSLGRPFTYSGRGYKSTVEDARDKDIRVTNCVIVGNWVMKDAGFYGSGIYNHTYDGSFSYTFTSGSECDRFFKKYFEVIDLREKEYSISELTAAGGVRPGDIIGYKGHNQTILPLGCTFDGGRGLNTDRPESGAMFLRWVGPNPYPDMKVGFIFRPLDSE